MSAAKQVGATWNDEQWDAGSPSAVVARKPTIMRMLILWALVFGSVVCGGATGVRGEAELLPERPEGAVEGDADIGAYPRPDAGYVTDLADMLSRDEEERIEQLLWRAESEKGVEIAVGTIDSLKEYPGTANDSIESFATELFNRYRIGNLPKNDGVLLLVSKRDHKMRIELGKRGNPGRGNPGRELISQGMPSRAAQHVDGNRTWFGNTGTRHVPQHTDYEEETFWASHGALGGDPAQGWSIGDGKGISTYVTGGMTLLTPPSLDQKHSDAVWKWMRAEAVVHGVPLGLVGDFPAAAGSIGSHC